ncbi:EcoKI restriction-modification system protein HsdS [uncultured Bacteroides sp.]|uniref:restriction endonuclease subunit S n=1 Tax=Bacteroides cellulolyticus TaxID=2981780 RepID=UPI000822BACA|nr:restriction endonuclease subunit S [Bacteroides cellulolyticus]MCU6770650.1 restriction endonuclease subunit S [Bacteroides cellulolyticus]SCH22545.1 EcoKI restriction-modification system protein HsdS [uncultured Bacteroides sp.]
MENRYDKYKDSGIAWIGEIPEHWEVKRVKNICSQTNIKENSKGNPLPYIGLENIESGSGKYVDTTSEVDGIANRFCKNNVLFGKLRPYLSKVYLAKSDGICSTEFIVYDTKENDCRFIHKLLLSQAFIEVVNSSTYGAKMPRANSDFINNIYVQIPPLSEQQSIANYLEQKCGEIDEMITLQEEMITKLQSYKQSVITEAVTKGLDKNVPLKDSGIEWIGEIPEHWEVKRLKFSCNVFGRIGFRGYKSDDLVSEGNGAITLSPSNMKDMKMDYTNRTYLSWKKYYESPEIMISKNDILMVKTGSTYGKCSFVDDIPMECTINPQIVVFKQHKDYPKFLAYSFQTKATRAFVETSVVGGTIPTIAQEKIMNYFFAFPPLSEQQSIANYLDQKCSEIDELISIKQQKIEKLKDYKKSLIFECVTGKRKV